MEGGFECSFCHAHFPTRALLSEHVNRRHLEDNSDRSDSSGSESEFKSNTAQSDMDPYAVPTSEQQRTLSRILQNLNLPDNPLSKIGQLTEDTLLQLSKQPSLSVISYLFLNDLGLSSFSNWDQLNISRLSSLTKLEIGNNYLRSISDLAQLPWLQILRISNNFINDLGPLSAISSLTELYADHNYIADISPLAACTQIILLDLNNNKISDLHQTIRALQPLIQLDTLIIFANPIYEIARDARAIISGNLPVKHLDVGRDVPQVNYNATSVQPVSGDSGSNLIDIRAFEEEDRTQSEPRRLEIGAAASTVKDRELGYLREENSKLKDEVANLRKLLENVAVSRQ